MKVNPFLLVISLLLSGLIFYAFYVPCAHLPYALTTSLVAALTLIPAMSISIKDAHRLTVMVKVTSGAFFALTLVLNVLFAIWNIPFFVFIITNGVLLCACAVIVYSIAKTKQKLQS